MPDELIGRPLTRRMRSRGVCIDSSRNGILKDDCCPRDNLDGHRIEKSRYDN
jgi:hypothetical protein